MNNQYESSILHTITPNRLTAFLIRKGWQQVNHPNDKLLVFQGLSLHIGQPVTVVFPSNAAFSDYFPKLNDTLRLLSKHLEIPLPKVVDYVSHWDRDVMRIRIQAEVDEDQLLPFGDAVELINKYKDFMAFAACTEADPKKFYGRLSKTGKEFADRCKFGHTFIGSFGITIESPISIDPQLPLPGFDPPRPFHRAVTERIATGYLNLNEAVKKEDPSIIVNNHLQGFSGNMCEILADIYDTMDGREVQHSIAWASELTPPKILEDINTQISTQSYEMLKSAAVDLQKVDKPDEDKIVFGRIIQLRSKVPPVETSGDASATRIIVISWDIEKQNTINLHIELPIDEYRAACDAHKNGREVRVIGKPQKHGKFWYLLEHHSFTVL
jgi:hypothetical protein